jgi:pimeloyl-ACP methyl ester carboxylesterase
MRIHHDQQGEGHPIVLVHGWGISSRRNWVGTGWAAALEPLRRVVLLDVRGHGKSEKPRVQKAYGVHAMSEDVIQVMDDLDIETADLFGYSMGAFIGAALLGAHPDRFTSMILGGIGNDSGQSAAALHVVTAALGADDPASISDPVGRLYRAWVDADPTSDREALVLAAMESWADGDPVELGGPGLRQAEVPVLVINGADDHPNVDTAQELVDALRKPELVVIPDTDHFSALTDPRFRSAVLEFLGRREPGFRATRPSDGR